MEPKGAIPRPPRLGGGIRTRSDGTECGALRRAGVMTRQQTSLAIWPAASEGACRDDQGVGTRADLSPGGSSLAFSGGRRASTWTPTECSTGDSLLFWCSQWRLLRARLI